MITIIFNTNICNNILNFIYKVEGKENKPQGTFDSTTINLTEK